MALEYKPVCAWAGLLVGEGGVWLAWPAAAGTRLNAMDLHIGAESQPMTDRGGNAYWVSKWDADCDAQLVQLIRDLSALREARRAEGKL